MGERVFLKSWMGLKMFREFFEKNSVDFNYGNFLVVKLQVLLVLMLLVIFLQFVLGSVWIGVIEGPLVLGYLYVLFREIRGEFAGEFKSYLVFFGIVLVFVQASWILLIVFSDLLERVNFFFYLLGGLMIFLFLFRLVFRKEEVSGKVLLSGEGLAVVELKYDLISMVKGGKFVVGSKKKYKKGEKVKVELRKGFWKKKPFRIIGKI